MIPMNKAMLSAIEWLTKKLNQIESRLRGNENGGASQGQYVDLAPTDCADEDGIYSDAIEFALDNDRVSNIALTGPYGSGKSSIIRSFLKKYEGAALHISLATFVPLSDKRQQKVLDAEGKGPQKCLGEEGKGLQKSLGEEGKGLQKSPDDEKVSRQDIERSILQQMLYGADANRLPHSRFKRIQSPNFFSILKSFINTSGLLLLAYLFIRRNDISNGSFFEPFTLDNWFNLLLFFLAIAFIWRTFHRIYVATFGLSLKSISLKDVELRPAEDDKTSILNHHLDEIIYFFQKTKYELVIIEDLDRFEDSEIFVTLREINSLVNENAGVKRSIKFLYALRDDMFVHTDRTKFFEFIIPVIPIINASNSIDMVLKQGQRLNLNKHLNPQFLREVSRYLSDLRLIQNIFNEFGIYKSNLESDEEIILDQNKLLAVLIYKNVYPRDFEQLHRGEGAFAEILSLRERLINNSEAALRVKIKKIEEQIKDAEQQLPANLKQLRQIYAMAIVEKLPLGINGISHNQNDWIALSSLSESDQLEQLVASSKVHHRNMYNHVGSINITNLQREVDPQRTFAERKKEVEDKAELSRSKYAHELSELRSEITKVRTAKLGDLLRSDDSDKSKRFSSFGQHSALAQFLILEGHLDDTYYQYTSLFHSGRLSHNDNKFLIQIRAYITPDPSFPIDNPTEVIEEMRSEDFGQSYILNVKLVDTLLQNPSLHSEKQQKLFAHVSSEFDEAEEFLLAYYISGDNVESLLCGLVNNEESFVSSIILSSNASSHVAQLIDNLTEKSLQSLISEYDNLSGFVSESLPEILSKKSGISPQKLGSVGVVVRDLNSIREHLEVITYVFERGLYEITTENLEFIYQEVIGHEDITPMRTQNLTTIQKTKNNFLIDKINANFVNYAQNVLLALTDNKSESPSAITKVISHPGLDKGEIEQFLEGQENSVPNLEDIPEGNFEILFNLVLVEPTWLNCLTYIQSQAFNADSLIQYLESETVLDALTKQSLPKDSDYSELRSFVFNANSLSDDSYRRYITLLPLNFRSFPEEMDSDKLLILIEEGTVNFTKESLDVLSYDPTLQIEFVKTNIDEYLEGASDFELDDDFHVELLQSLTSDSKKHRIIELLDFSLLPSSPERAELVGSIINQVNYPCDNFKADVAQALIIQSKPIETQISLLNKCQPQLTDQELQSVLRQLPRPYSKITSGRHQPSLIDNSVNRELAEILDERDIISSWRPPRYIGGKIKLNLYRS